MYPDFSYIFHDLFGTPVDNWTQIFKTFGLFLVFAIISASIILRNELKKLAAAGKFKPQIEYKIIGEQPKISDLIGNAILGFIIGFKGGIIFSDFDTFRQDPAASLMSTEGNLLLGLLGLGVFAAYKYWAIKRKALPKPVKESEEVFPHNKIGEITVYAAVSGVIGAKLFAVLETPAEFLERPIEMLFSGAGLAIYGGLIGGFFGVRYYLKRNNIPFLYVADAVAPALFIAYGVGRLGCHFSGDGDWGIVAASIPEWWFLPEWLWSYDYPNNVAKAGVLMEGCTGIYCKHLVPPVYPTAIYEMLMSMLLAFALIKIRPRLKVPGMLFAIYMIMNGVERFFIEKIRVNVTYDWPFGLQPTQAEVISVIFILIGLLLVYLLRSGKLKN
jgi:phosphatidylglycerol---prolipoprotein diacylglyceryl transferase